MIIGVTVSKMRRLIGFATSMLYSPTFPPLEEISAVVTILQELSFIGGRLKK
jgi:hypothetical protein